MVLGRWWCSGAGDEGLQLLWREEEEEERTGVEGIILWRVVLFIPFRSRGQISLSRGGTAVGGGEEGEEGEGGVSWARRGTGRGGRGVSVYPEQQHWPALHSSR